MTSFEKTLDIFLEASPRSSFQNDEDLFSSEAALFYQEDQPLEILFDKGRIDQLYNGAAFEDFTGEVFEE